MGVFRLVPKGRYLLRISKVDEGFSGNGDYKVTVTFEVAAPKDFALISIPFHNVTFLPAGRPGSGIAIHFLKSIGEPWEERETLDINPERWIGKLLWAEVDVNKYQKTMPDGNVVDRQTNKIQSVDTVEGTQLPEGVVPF
jgi:hypothetical protein